MALNEEKDKAPTSPIQPEIKKLTRAKRTVVAKPPVSEPEQITPPVTEEVLLETIEVTTFTLDNNSDDNADLIQKKSKKETKNKVKMKDKDKKKAKKADAKEKAKQKAKAKKAKKAKKDKAKKEKVKTKIKAKKAKAKSKKAKKNKKNKK